MTTVPTSPGSSPEPLRLEGRIALDAVAGALAFAVEGRGADEITSKGGRDLVTAVDTAVEDRIRRELEDGIGYPVIGEERGGSAPSDGSPYWLVDPICGTRNLASGTPLYSVNLALVEGGIVTLGVAGDPSTGEIALAERGRGAWARPAAERGTGWRRLRTDASSLVVCGEDGKASGFRREQAAGFIGRLVRADRWDFLSLATTLSSVYVATGRIAGYVVFRAPSLHAAAGTLLITEAGGVLSNVDGGPWTLESDTLLAAANEDLHAALLKLALAARPDGT